MTETVESALVDVWQRSLPLLEERLTAIERAIDELSAQSAESSLRVGVGCAEAHKLAGVLGTFGLDRGTELARDLEAHLGLPDAGREAARLSRVAAELRNTVEGAPSP